MSIGTVTAALSLGLCLGAGQLIATPATYAVTPVAAEADAKVTPSVRTAISARSITKGQQVRVTVRYTDPGTGAAVTSGTVRLQAYRSGKWINATAATLNGDGVANLYAKPAVSGYLRAVYLGNDTYTSHTGVNLSVTVKSDTGARILAEANKHVGALYKFGAAGPKRFDCSGFTLYVYQKTIGKSLPHKANLQQKYGIAVAKSKAQIGDLIVFRSGSYGSHVGIYAGNGYMYDSPHTGARVTKRKIYQSNYVVRRLAA
ncbi:NlpC/P60 family protein [Actinoplanes sp. KI2]|uniref:C40 family peptidase n=1 Tax=Actinoplanes sp. KI2 TaxID=2983315 RepID=UPI0021D5B78D|nr:NlpC/P60 family protein [Actinoplanes sp. KI2]MCU7723997.1 NlpC/P60 family protein [Actinoplanes sp. KI2]